jgi:hypothetical protein
VTCKVLSERCITQFNVPGFHWSLIEACAAVYCALIEPKHSGSFQIPTAHPMIAAIPDRNSYRPDLVGTTRLTTPPNLTQEPCGAE